MDDRFKVSQRRRDSSAILLLYDALKERGWKENDESTTDEA